MFVAKSPNTIHILSNVKQAKPTKTPMKQNLSKLNRCLSKNINTKPTII